MKIVYLMASTGAWGGLEKHVFELAGAMAERGHNVTVLADATYRTHCPTTVTLQAFDWAGSRWNPLRWLKLRRALQGLAPDIVHAHAAKAVSLLARAGWPACARAIGTAHNLKSGYRDYAKLNAVIAVSRSIIQGIQHPHLYVVHNGIRETQPNPEALHAIQQWLADKPRPLVLAVGRLVPAKGFDLLLEAWPDNIQATLVILGGGPEAEALQRLREQRQLHSAHLLGESTEVREWLACADLLVISSRNEGGPYVMAEALLAGVPVVSTDVGMVAEFLNASCITSNITAPALQERLRWALDNPEMLRQNSNDAMQNAQARLTLDAMTRHTESIYQQTRQAAQ